MNTVKHFFQLEYANAKKGTSLPGFGDFLRGSCALIPICERLDLQLSFYFHNHPIGKYLESGESDQQISSLSIRMIPANLVGDVVAVTPLYTILNQVGGSVGSEEPVNRTILIPNAMLFGTLIINYTPKEQEKLIEQFRKRFEKGEGESGPAYILDEFVLRITFDSDWDEAERILLNAAREVTADIIKATGQEPYIRADVSDWYGVFMRLRFMTLATERPRIMYELTKKIIKAIQESDKVDIAIPYVYSLKRPFPLMLNLPETRGVKSLIDNATKKEKCES